VLTAERAAAKAPGAIDVKMSGRVISNPSYASALPFFSEVTTYRISSPRRSRSSSWLALASIRATARRFLAQLFAA